MKKKSKQWDPRILYGGMIAVIMAVFLWMAHSTLLGASLFFVPGATYTFLLFRVLPQSSRASMLMLCALPLASYSALSIEDDLGIPAAASWFLGVIVGGIASGYPWSGKRSQAAKKPSGTVGAGKESVGGRRQAMINGSCAAVLMGAGLGHFIFQSPTAAVGAVLAGALVCGWALFRFPPSAVTRNALLLVIPVEFFLLAFLGGNTSQMALPFVWTYGALAGVLLGGHYWSGPLVGAPRPPFSSQEKRRRKRKKVRRSQDKQKQNKVPAGRR
ncbi:hypothetical protein [Arthrobacter sp. YN]|uniref:hypothetical protein n=1 Tax=Arthrobacter sp. YN TaxID=2020486 RepID=UPI001E38648F|nr:hypothetical protein [Arthrobacter sp. YN]